MGREVKNDLSGKVYGRLTVIKWVTLSGWHCQCSCGNIRDKLSTEHLINDRVRSCGCLKESKKTKAGLSKSKEANSYHSMLLRTGTKDYNLSHPEHYEKYLNGSRPVCSRWSDDENGFFNFLKDMGERPEGTSLERIDNSLGYFPENCKWATDSEQTYNRGKFKNNTTGKTGVYRRKEKESVWMARISHEGVTYSLGNFKSYEAAVKAREEAELKYYGYIKG